MRTHVASSSRHPCPHVRQTPRLPDAVKNTPPHHIEILTHAQVQRLTDSTSSPSAPHSPRPSRPVANLALPPLVDPVLSQQYDDHNQESNRLLFECGVRLRGIVDKPRGEPLKLFHEQPRPRLPQVAHDSASRS